MTTTIGRCVLGEDPTTITVSGPYLTLEGYLVASSYAELAVRRAQLNGMVDNPDEDAFPAVFSETPELDGFYSCDSVQVGVSSESMVGFLAPYTVTLRQVNDAAQPKAEIQYVGTRRTNSHGITAASSLTRRNDLEAWDDNDQDFTSQGRTSDDGVAFNAYNVDNAESSTVSYEPEPDAHYDGAASVEVLRDGGDPDDDADWDAWTGRQLPRVPPSSVRLNNHLARFAISDAGVMTHRIYDPTAAAWESAAFTLSATPFASSYLTFDTASGPTILRNDIDAVVVRYNMRPSVDYTSYGAIFATVTMRAGEMFACVHLTATKSQVSTVVAASPATAATSITGGLRRTSNDANGNRWVVSTPHTFYGDTTDGYVRVSYTASTTPTYMIGQALNGSSATGYNTESALVTEFMTQVAAKTRIVAR